MLYSVETTINNQEVYLVVEDDLTISFTIDCEFDKVNSENKVAITKWLLKEWAKVKVRFAYLHCKPYSHDGNAEYRTSVFTKLGFKTEGNLLSFGDKANASLSVPFSYSKGKLIVRDLIEDYYYPAINLPYRYRRNELTVTNNIEGYFYKAVNNPSYKRARKIR